MVKDSPERSLILFPRRTEILCGPQRHSELKQDSQRAVLTALSLEDHDHLKFQKKMKEQRVEDQIILNVGLISSPWSGNSLRTPLLISSSLLCLVDIFLSNTFKKNKHKLRIKSLLKIITENIPSRIAHIHHVQLRAQTSDFLVV